MSTISASTTSTTAFKVTSDTTGTLVLQTGSTPTTAVTIDTSQNVGIGTTSPSYTLDVSGTAARFTRSGKFILINANYAATNTNADIQTDTGMALSFSPAGSERMRLDTSGNLGLGVTSVSWGGSYKALQVSTAAGVSSNGGNGSAFSHNYYYDGTNDKYITTGYAASRVFHFNGAIRFDLAPSGTAGNNVSFTQAMTLDSSGNFMVGQTSSSYRFAVTGTCYISNTVSGSYNTSSNSTLGVFGMNTNGAVDNGRVCNIEWKMNGDAQGQFWYANYITQGGSRTLGAYCTGTAWTNSSDIANKENITPIKYGLETVMASRPVDFDWKSMRDEAGKGRADIGFIAQEMELLVPEVVTGQEGGKGISYGNLVAIAFKAIQEQQAIIETLTNRITALEAK